MSSLKSALFLIWKQYGYWSLVFAGVLFLGLWFLIYTQKPAQEETVAVRKGDFIQQVTVSGKVVAAEDVDLGFAQSGRISRTYARVGEKVSAGTLIAEVENGDIRALVLQKKAALAAERAKLLSLQNGGRPEEVAVSQAALDSANQSLLQANIALQNAIRDAYTKADDAVRNKLDSALNNPRTAFPTLTFTSADSSVSNRVLGSRVSAEASLSSWSQANQMLSTSDLLQASADATKRLNDIASLLDDAALAVSKGIPGGAVSQTTLDTYATNIGTGRTNVNTAISSLTSAATAQKSAVAALVSAKKSLELTKAPAAPEDIAAQQARVDAASADVSSAEAQLGKTLIVAPFSGVVTRMDAKSGETASPGVPLISMISVGTFQIESYIPEVNVSLLSVGNKASTTLDAYGFDVVFPVKVVAIDPAETLRDGVSTYKMLLQFEGEDDRIRSGMTGTVVITAQKRPGVLLLPEGAVMTDTDSPHVRVVDADRKIKQREVVLGGRTSFGDIEILSGVSEGELVALPRATE